MSLFYIRIFGFFHPNFYIFFRHKNVNIFRFFSASSVLTHINCFVVFDLKKTISKLLRSHFIFSRILDNFSMTLFSMQIPTVFAPASFIIHRRNFKFLTAVHTYNLFGFFFLVHGTSFTVFFSTVLILPR